MSVTVYGVKYTCDLCGIDGHIADQYPASAIRYDRMPMPEGWTSLDLMTLQVTDHIGAAIRHLCYSCGGLSLEGIVARIKAKSERERMRT